MRRGSLFPRAARARRLEGHPSPASLISLWQSPRLHKASLDDNSAEHIYANGHAPSRRSLGKAALAAEQTAERTRDARHLLEAEALKRELKAELDRVPGAPQRTRRSDKA